MYNVHVKYCTLSYNNFLYLRDPLKYYRVISLCYTVSKKLQIKQGFIKYSSSPTNMQTQITHLSRKTETHNYPLSTRCICAAENEILYNYIGILSAHPSKDTANMVLFSLSATRTWKLAESRTRPARLGAARMRVGWGRGWVDEEDEEAWVMGRRCRPGSPPSSDTHQIYLKTLWNYLSTLGLMNRIQQINL